MSTTTDTGVTPAASAAAEKEDPWRYGSRYLRHEAPDGTVTYEEVPLKKEDLLYPEEGDRLVLTEGHVNDCHYLRGALKHWASDKPDALVLSDHRVDWQVPGLQPLGPDVVVFRGVHRPWDPQRGTFPVADFRARTLLAIEVTSPDTRSNDLGPKVELYHRAGVPFYAIVDRHQTRNGLDLRLVGYRIDPADPDRYTEAPLDERGRLWLVPVRLWLAAENGCAVCYDERRNRIPDIPELAVEVKREAEARQAAEAHLKAAAEAREAAEAHMKAELEARRAAETLARTAIEIQQTAEARAQAAEARAAAAEIRAKELEAELRRLRSQSQGTPPNPAAP